MRLPLQPLPVHVRLLPTNVRLKSPLQDRRPVKIPLVICHEVLRELSRPVCLRLRLSCFRLSTRYPLAIDEARAEVGPVPSGIEWLPPTRDMSVTCGKSGFTETYQKLWKWYEYAPLKKPLKPSACGAALFSRGVKKKSPNLRKR